MKKNIEQATLMIQAFESVGCNYFTLVAEKNNETVFIRRAVDAEFIKLNLRNDLEHAARVSCNLHLRPYSRLYYLVQLDDIRIFPFCVCASPLEAGEATAGRVNSPFIITETSSKSYQCWLALNKKFTVDETKIIKKIYQADLGATGSCRLAGSTNFKEKYSPNFPTVRVVFSSLYTLADYEELSTQIIQFNARQAAPRRLSAASHKHKKEFNNITPGPKLTRTLAWPFYSKAIQQNDGRRDGWGPDRSRADFAWAIMALKFGHSVEEVAAKLQQISDKAREKSEYEAELYAFNTALRASEVYNR